MTTVAVLHAFFVAQPDVVLAYLFGSQAQGSAMPDSDYDVAVLATSSLPPARGFQLASEIGRLLGGAPVDVIPLDAAPIELAYAVIASGRCVYERELLARVEFEADVLSRYGDRLYLLREQRADLIRGGQYEAGVQRNRAALRQTERVLAEARAAA